MREVWKPCYCSAYDFPHREGGGQCAIGQTSPKCSSCGKVGEGHWEEEGSGYTEFWGQLHHESVRVLRSNCCNAEMNLTIKGE